MVLAAGAVDGAMVSVCQMRDCAVRDMTWMEKIPRRTKH